MLGIRYNLLVADKVTSITNYGFQTEWDGRLLRAQCHKAFWKPEHKEIPHEGCFCGFYAFDRLINMQGLVDWIAPLAITVLVEAYGKVIICKRGFRAEYMKPVYLVWPLEISQTRSTGVQQNGLYLTHWIHEKYIVPEFDLAIRASKILHIPMISPVDASYLIQ